MANVEEVLSKTRVYEYREILEGNLGSQNLCSRLPSTSSTEEPIPPTENRADIDYYGPYIKNQYHNPGCIDIDTPTSCSGEGVCEVNEIYIPLQCWTSFEMEYEKQENGATSVNETKILFCSANYSASNGIEPITTRLIQVNCLSEPINTTRLVRVNCLSKPILPG